MGWKVEDSRYANPPECQSDESECRLGADGIIEVSRFVNAKPLHVAGIIISRRRATCTGIMPGRNHVSYVSHKALCQEIYAALCQENMLRLIRVRLYARRVCHGSYVWNDTIKEEEKEEEEPRILILRRVQEEEEPRILILRRVQEEEEVPRILRVPREYVTFHTCEALCRENIPRFIRVRLYMPGRGRSATYLTCAKALCQEEE